jgi:hypothetical protein
MAQATEWHGLHALMAAALVKSWEKLALSAHPGVPRPCQVHVNLSAPYAAAADLGSSIQCA